MIQTSIEIKFEKKFFNIDYLFKNLNKEDYSVENMLGRIASMYEFAIIEFEDILENRSSGILIDRVDVDSIETVAHDIYPSGEIDIGKVYSYKNKKYWIPKELILNTQVGIANCLDGSSNFICIPRWFFRALKEYRPIDITQVITWNENGTGILIRPIEGNLNLLKNMFCHLFVHDKTEKNLKNSLQHYFGKVVSTNDRTITLVSERLDFENGYSLDKHSYEWHQEVIERIISREYIEKIIIYT